jgi:hypothetical protein
LAAGVRLALALGPSALFVQPHGELTPASSTARVSLFAAVQVSRAIWLGRFGLLPQLGLRLFSSERGVRIDRQRQLVLGGLTPHVSLGLAYMD